MKGTSHGDRRHKFSPIIGKRVRSSGLQDVAYIKTDAAEGETVYAIHAADGRQLATAKSSELAVATVLENDLTPLSIH